MHNHTICELRMKAILSENIDNHTKRIEYQEDESKNKSIRYK